MKLARKILGLTLFLTLAFSAITVMASSLPDVTVTLDGELIEFQGQQPIITGGRTLVPVRGVFEALGFYPTFDEDTRQATLTREDFVVIIQIGSRYFTTNGETFTLDVPAQIIMGRTMLPLRAVLQSIGYNNMDFDPITRVVSIYTTPLAEGDTLTRERLGLSITRLEYGDDDLIRPLTYMHLVNHGSETGDTLLIRVAVPISDVTILYIGPDATEEYAFFVPGERISVTENVLPSEGIIVQNYMGNGSFPWSAITFLDENGERWYFAIVQNQADELIYSYFLVRLVRDPMNEEVFRYEASL